MFTIGAVVAVATGVFLLADPLTEETEQTPWDEYEDSNSFSLESTPAQPIAIIVDSVSTTSFHKYLGEILLAEGLNSFQYIDLSSMDDVYLASYATVLLPPMALFQAQIDLLTKYVSKGGNLIAMQPDSALARLFGLQLADGLTVRGYMVLREGDRTPLQLHAKAAHYKLSGASVIADLYRDRSTPTDFPAITTYKHDRGRAIMFAYDLPVNIALTRQGNPELANQKRDGLEGIRPSDMFVDWVDPSNIQIPQADLQARLLVRLIEDLLGNKMPLPRLWYFPAGARSIILFTGDAYEAPARFIQDTLTTVESYDGNASVYYSPPADNRKVSVFRLWLERLLPFLRATADEYGRPSSDEVNTWRTRGHEFSTSPRAEQGVDAGIVRDLRAFRQYGYGPVSRTVRIRENLWSGWVETAKLLARRRFRMSLDYADFGSSTSKTDGSSTIGHMIGSGLPMKFVDESGRLIQILQQPTQLVRKYPASTDDSARDGVDEKQASRFARNMIDRSINGDYSALAIQYQMDFVSSGEPRYLDSHRWLVDILSYAHDNAVPIWSAARWLEFVEARQEVYFRNLRWDRKSSSLFFDLYVPTPVNGLITVLIPAKFGGRNLKTVERDGQRMVCKSDRFAGREYSGVTAVGGSHSFAARYGISR